MHINWENLQPIKLHYWLVRNKFKTIKSNTALCVGRMKYVGLLLFNSVCCSFGDNLVVELGWHRAMEKRSDKVYDNLVANQEIRLLYMGARSQMLSVFLLDSYLINLIIYVQINVYNTSFLAFFCFLIGYSSLTPSSC